MGGDTMTRRTAVLVLVLLAAAAGRWQVEAIEPARASDLAALPLTLGDWTGVDGPPFDAAVLAVLGADDYLNRVYRTERRQVGLYVGYHRSQTGGASIHSPLNCLPGSGWQPMQAARVPFGDRGAVREVVIQKGEDRQLVLYWYQSLTRLEGDEYRSKLYLVVDAVRWRRNDAALVRIVSPIDPADPGGEAAARDAAYRFAERVEPAVRAGLFPSNGAS
jgi:EpsI family protein